MAGGGRMARRLRGVAMVWSAVDVLRRLSGLETGPIQRVAVVSGASRGIGKGIAEELGRSGYVVYCVGRTRRGALSVEATATAVTEAGGEGVALGADVCDDGEVYGVAERVRRERGRLDALVCSAFATPDADPATFRDDFWTQGAAMWDACHGAGLRASYALMCACAPTMIETAAESDSRPLVALVSSFGGKAYTFNVAYGVGKAAVDRLAADAAVQFASRGVDTVSLYPGVVATERNVELEADGKWAAASGGLDLSQAESPALTGRVLTEFLDPSRDQLRRDRSGTVQVVAELADEFSLLDPRTGRKPASIRSLKFIIPNFVLSESALDDAPKFAKPGLAWVRDNVPDFLLPWSVFTSGPPPVSNTADDS